MTDVALQQDGDEGASVHEHAIHFDSPKPLKYFLVCAEVLRRSLCTTNQARGLEDIVGRNTFQFFFKWCSSASRMTSDSDWPRNWAQTRSRWLRLLGMRTVNRWVGITLPSSV